MKLGLTNRPPLRLLQKTTYQDAPQSSPSDFLFFKALPLPVTELPRQKAGCRGTACRQLLSQTISTPLQAPVPPPGGRAGGEQSLAFREDTPKQGGSIRWSTPRPSAPGQDAVTKIPRVSEKEPEKGQGSDVLQVQACCPWPGRGR